MPRRRPITPVALSSQPLPRASRPPRGPRGNLGNYHVSPRGSRRNLEAAFGISYNASRQPKGPRGKLVHMSVVPRLDLGESVWTWRCRFLHADTGQRRKGQSRLSHACAEERPGRMRHAGRRGRALNMDGHQSRPPHHNLSLPSSVDAAWGSGHHQKTSMWGTRGLPSPHTTNCHAVACGPRRRNSQRTARNSPSMDGWRWIR